MGIDIFSNESRDELHEPSACPVLAFLGATSLFFLDNPQAECDITQVNILDTWRPNSQIAEIEANDSNYHELTIDHIRSWVSLLEDE
jgi:hypothetical protein